ncbi:MAG: D-alanyl-D-alanine carboxypeptidase/D-alanyl-D-alanine-endopeptidase, partial [Proteobacteria bacterium]|nr:D-alanyl-D-alanine carboxypeptidase/D-alanyl-D-alanine-endopeptidase [Pseudomonadota bacterium]
DVVEPPHFDEQKQERSGFRAPIAAFGVARSAVTVIVTAEPGGANIRLEPDSGDYVKLTKREVVTVDANQRSRVRVDARPKADHLEIEVSGQIRAVDGSWDQRRRVDDPARFAAEVLRKLLAERGVKVKRIAIGGATPTTAKLLAMHESSTLANVLREMNKLSDNYVAESVLKTLGAETRKVPGPGTWADGTAAVGAYLATIGLPTGSYRADNGSGLFAASSVSATQMVTILAAAHTDFRIGPDLLATLPVGGQDGTLARRWHGHPAQGRVRAKTGTLDRVVTLAGYIAMDANHVLAFAIFANDIAPGAKPFVREAADEIVDVLAAYLAR